MLDKNHKKPHLWQIIMSTIAAAFGVQSSKNRERDFSHGSLSTYIIAGVIFTVLFVISITLLVKWVLRSQGL